MMRDNLTLGAIVGLLLSFAILISNVVVPSFVDQPLADNEFSESVGWFVVIAVICWIGLLKVRRTSRIRDSMAAGAVISFVHVADGEGPITTPFETSIVNSVPEFFETP